MEALSFAAESSSLTDDTPAIVVKISGPSFELNVWLRLAEIERLRSAHSTRWERGSIRAGTSANASAFWSCDDGEVFIGVGHDDQTWDFGVSLPVEEFPRLLTELERALGAPTT